MTGTFRILLPLEQTNFKGRVELEVFDSSGRNAKVQKHYGIESGEKHREAGTAALTILTEPGRVVDGHPWYNGDVEIRADFQDSYTGLGSYAITADGERKKSPELPGGGRRTKWAGAGSLGDAPVGGDPI